MLISLLSANSTPDFADAVKTVRQAYLTGQYAAGGANLDLPFGKQFKERFEIKKDENNPLDDQNRKWDGDLNHMTNAVAAMAHIIRYAEKNLPNLGEFTPLRSLNLMHLAFYHDIGKTIIPRRHAIEGKVLFQEPKASVRWRFEQIFAAYGQKMPPETLHYYALIIGAHDMFGTISTGENGLLSLDGVIDRLRALHIDTREAVFDLWLLNLADIITSVNWINGKEQNKFQALDWTKYAPGNLDLALDRFLKSFNGIYLLEDLSFALRIIDGEDAKTIAENQATCRFGRLARQTLGNVLEEPQTILRNDLKNEIIAGLESPSLHVQIHEILRGEFGDQYPKMFGTMLQFDYALGFFQKMAKRAVSWLNEEDATNEEDTTNNFRTGWLYNRKTPKQNATNYDAAYLCRYNAECVINNFMMVIAGIFGEIYRITEEIEHWNIEFEDAKERLSDPKCDRLLGFDGPYRASNARHLLLRELMLYKA